MIRHKKLAFALAGVSFAALMASTPAFANGTIINGYTGPGFSFTSTSPGNTGNDYLFIQDVTTTKPVGNTGTIDIGVNIGGGMATQNQIGVKVEDESYIRGALEIDPSYVVNANIRDQSATDVAGVYVTDDSYILGGILNEGVIEAYADATPSTGVYNTAAAEAHGIDWNAAHVLSIPGSPADASVTNDAGARISAYAYAEATNIHGAGPSEDVGARGHAGGIDMDVANFGHAEAYVHNDGDISAYVSTHAKNVRDGYNSSLPSYDANADSSATGVWQQIQGGYGGPGDATVINDSGLYSTALSYAETVHGDADAHSRALGVTQEVYPNGNAGAYVTNTDYVGVYANAHARAAGSAAATAHAYATGAGAAQIVTTDGDGYASVHNDGGSWNVAVSTNAEGIGSGVDADANAMGAGALQIVAGSCEAIATTYNSGVMTVNVHSNAMARSNGEADASAIGAGAAQVALSWDGEAETTVNNQGTLSVHLGSNASSSTGSAYSNTIGFGAVQIAGSVYDDARAVVNNGEFDTLEVYGTANSTGYDAYSNSYIIGAAQIALTGRSGEAVAQVYNDGDLFAGARSTSRSTNSSGRADAQADSAGIKQLALGLIDGAGLYVENNSYGEIVGVAEARSFSGTDGRSDADAAATGAFGIGISLGNVNGLVDNAGDIIAYGTAAALGGNFAYSDASALGSAQLALHGGTASFTANNAAGAAIRATALSYAGGDTGFTPADNVANAQAESTGINQGALFIDLGGSSIDPGAAAKFATIAGDVLGVPEGRIADALTIIIGPSQGGDVNLLVHNDGDLYSLAHADAYGDHARANTHAVGVSQEAGSPSLLVGYGFAGHVYSTINFVDTSFDFYPSFNVGNYTATFHNDGLVDVASISDALSDGNGRAVAYGSAVGVYQRILAGTPLLPNDESYAETFTDNTGTIDAYAHSSAGAGGNNHLALDAIAGAVAKGVDQYAESISQNGLARADLQNLGDGTITGHGVAEAYGQNSNVVGWAFASGYGAGALQQVEAFAAAAYATNEGTIIGHGDAYARQWGIDGHATAYATGVGLGQIVTGYFAEAYLHNSADISAHADAVADGYYAEAYAVSFAHYIGSNGPNVTVGVDVYNEHGATISAEAHSHADGANGYEFAGAMAAGAWYAGRGFYATGGAGNLQGVIDNDGVISGSAYAESEYGNARAFGVVQVATRAYTTLNNSGMITAFARGQEAYATAIAIGSYRVGPPPGPSVAEGPQSHDSEINNYGGAIIAGIVEETKGAPLPGGVLPTGEQVHRGFAINLKGFDLNGEVVPTGNAIDLVYGAAGGPVEINFFGDGLYGEDTKNFVLDNDLVGPQVAKMLAQYGSIGYVYGNVDLTGDDHTHFRDGVTVFDGVINPGGDLSGDLYLEDYTKAVFVQNSIDGAAGANVDDFWVKSGATMAVELTPRDENPGDYTQIHADHAELDGRFLAIYEAGLYKNYTNYADVVYGENGITGYFSTVEDNSALLDTQARYRTDVSGDHVDIYAERIAFDEVAGETKNMKNVGGAIENVYSTSLPPSDFSNMVANLFTLNDHDYLNFLNQLSGAEYANHLQSVLWSTRAIDRIITERMECTDNGAYQSASAAGDVKVGNNTVTPTADAISSTGCFRPGEANIWMSGFGQWNSLSGDNNAPGYDEKQYGILFGADYAFNEDFFLGLAGGYFNSQGDFDKWGGRSGSTIDYDGLQIAAYGGYDNSKYYLRGIVAYGNYTGDAHRIVNLDGAPVDPSGNPDSNTWSFYGETGYRFAISNTGALTPFAGLSLATANLDGFTEKDPQGTGAALKIHDSDANSVASVLGARFTADLAMGAGVFTPIVSVAWMHEFGDTAQEVHMSFAGAPAGANFTSVGSEVSRDSAVVDAGAKFSLSDDFNLGLFYNGQFNADYQSNGVTATLGYKF